MADLVELDRANIVKISGANPASGITDFYAQVSSTGSLQISGEGVAGTPAGGVVSIQGVSGGTALPVTVSNLPTVVDTNYGIVGSSSLRTASQIGNATGAADFAAGNSSAQTLRVVIATNQAAVAISAASLPLPTGAATETTLSALNTKVTTTANGIKVDGSAVTQPVSAASLPLPTGASTEATLAKLPLAQGSATASQSGILIQGAVTTASPAYTTAQTSPLSLTTAGALRTDSSAVTQPISAASLPLPAGAATSALQTTANTSLASIDAGIPNALGAATTANSMPVNIASDQTVPVSAASLPLPIGAATSALQTSGNASLSSIDTKTPALGQKTMANSVPVVVASDQSAIPFKLEDGSGNLIGSNNSQLQVRDVINTSGQNRAQSVTTSAAEALGAATILANRKFISLTPTNGTIYWGFANTVTTSTGSPIFKNQTITIAVTDNVHIYVIAAQTTDVRIAEGS